MPATAGGAAAGAIRAAAGDMLPSGEQRPPGIKLPRASSAGAGDYWGAPASPASAGVPVVDVLHRQPDQIADTIASMRRARQGGDASYAAQTLAVVASLSKDGDKATAAGAGASGTATSRLAAKSEPAGVRNKQTLEQRRQQVHNPWQPNYEVLHLNDLFTLTGELTERMTETMAHVVKLIKSFEPQFLEIYNYYASLGQVRYIDDKLILVKAQFSKLARATGVVSSPRHPTMAEQAEDGFFLIADRVASYFADFAAPDHFITFPEFPEVVCRLAATKYDWRPPDCPDDGEDDIAQPEALRTVPLANIHELPTANRYGVGPTAKPGTSASQDAGQALSPRTQTEMLQRHRSDNDGEELALTGIVSQLGPQPPDVVLYTIVKTYILHDLLPNVRVAHTMGSRVSKARSHVRTAPTSVWMG